MPKLLTKEDFISRSIEKHGDKYSYDLVEYISNRHPVKIICKEHGIFEQVAESHYRHGCRKCYFENKEGKDKLLFIERARQIHGDNYDYSLLPDTLKSYEKVDIICKEGHIFKQSMNGHLNNRRPSGCPTCAKPCYDKESFIKLSNEKHGNKYDYSKTVYQKQKDKVIITCPKHGDFKQTPANHYHLLRGCPRCKESKGEIEVRKWLESKNINFEKEKTFDGCFGKKKLRFDFYLPEYNTCIEFDGAQHFKIIEQFGGEKEFERNKSNDYIKTKYCLDNNIPLIRLNYKDLDRGDIHKKLFEYFFI
jgi:hypothetical protein